MLIATREDRVRHDAHPVAPQFGPAEPMRSLSSRFTGSVQFLGSFVGIPLALLGGYATYTSNFSVEAKCQSLRGSIVSMLDKKADPSTLRLLMQRDVAIFQRDCGEVDPDAVAAFKNLLVAERAPAPRPAKVETKTEAVKAEPVKAEPAPKADADATAKAEAPKKSQPAPAVVKREADKPVQDAKTVRKPEATPANVAVAKPAEQPEPKVEMPQVKQAEHPEPKPMEASLSRSEGEQADSVWIASVRDALRESAARPVAEPQPDAAAAMPPPVVVSAPPRLVRDVTPRLVEPPRPPADIPNVVPKDERPMPPAAIPHADASGTAAPASN